MRKKIHLWPLWLVLAVLCGALVVHMFNADVPQMRAWPQRNPWASGLVIMSLFVYLALQDFFRPPK